MSYLRHARLMLDPGSKSSGRRAWLQLFLALFLLLSQAGLFLHELEHQSAAPDAYCALCLAAQHLGDALHTTHTFGSVPPPVFAPLQLAVPSVPADPGMPFSARAPPRLVLA